MLEYRQEMCGLVVDLVPAGPYARGARTLARFAHQSSTRYASPPSRHWLPGAPTTAGAYLVALGVALLAGSGARRLPYPILAGAGVAAALGLAAYVLCRGAARRAARRRAVLRDKNSGAIFFAALEMASTTLAVWPSVADLIGPTDPDRLLQDALWTVARRLSQREAMRERLARLHRTDAALPPDSGLKGEAASQYRSALGTLQGHERDLAVRLGELRRLASACREFRYRTAHPQPGPLPGDPAVSDVVDRAESVVDAYRQMLGRPAATTSGRPDDPAPA